MSALLVYLGLSVGSFYALWTLYLAVMSLHRAEISNTLPKVALVLGVPILAVGLAIDAAVNWCVMTLVLLELPQEVTVTARLKRHNRATGGWRKKVVGWFKPLLDPFDPSGGHI
jgi:hypothetical protein